MTLSANPTTSSLRSQAKLSTLTDTRSNNGTFFQSQIWLSHFVYYITAVLEDENVLPLNEPSSVTERNGQIMFSKPPLRWGVPAAGESKSSGTVILLTWTLVLRRDNHCRLVVAVSKPATADCRSVQTSAPGSGPPRPPPSPRVSAQQTFPESSPDSAIVSV